MVDVTDHVYSKSHGNLQCSFSLSITNVHLHSIIVLNTSREVGKQEEKKKFYQLVIVIIVSPADEYLSPTGITRLVIMVRNSATARIATSFYGFIHFYQVNKDG